MDTPSSPIVFVGIGATSVAEAVITALGGACRTVTTRGALESALTSRRCAVVCVARAVMDELSWVAGLQRRRPDVPVLLAAELSTSVASGLASFRGTLPEVVWAPEVPSRLRAAVSQTAARDIVATVLNELRDAVPMTPLVDQALRKAAKAWPPFASVGLLASALHVARGTLYEHWANAFGAGLTPKDMLEWVLLLRAISLPERTSDRVAATVGVDRRTLERMCQRRIGMRLAAARRLGVEAALGVLRNEASALLG